MNSIFLDTVGLIALWDETDQWHTAATPVFAALLAAHRNTATTTSVSLECGNAAARRTYRTDVDDLRRKMLAHQRLIEPSAEDVEQAWTDYRAGFAGNAGIVDCISFAVMRRLGMTEAFTNDRHFQAAGFAILF